MKVFILTALIFVCNIRLGPGGQLTNNNTVDSLDLLLYRLPAARHRPVLTGSFITFWGKEQWRRQQWDELLDEMKDIGLTTLIIQFSAYDNAKGASVTWFNSADNFTARKYPAPLEQLLLSAAGKQMEVYIGLYFSEEYWQNKQTDSVWLRTNADKCNFIATEIQEQFGNFKAFKGWYIPHEPEPYAYNNAHRVAIFKKYLVDRISDHLHTLSSKPVSIAAFFNSRLSTSEQLSDFMAELGKCNLQVIMLQDGIGVNHVSLEDLGRYYRAADKGLFLSGDAGYKGEFWSDLETFHYSGALPANIYRIKSQLKIEFEAPNLSKAVCFQYFNDMSLTGRNAAKSAGLRAGYVEYLKRLE